MTDQELKDLVASLAVQSAKTDALIAKYAAKADERLAQIDARAAARQAEADARAEARQAEAEARRAEAEARQAEADAKADERRSIADERRSIAEAKADERKAEIDAHFLELKRDIDNLVKADALARVEAQAERKEMNRFMKELGQRMGSITNNQGDVAEEFFYNSLNAAPQLGGISFNSVTPNLILGARKAKSEFDIVLVNGESVALVEVKYKAHANDLDQLQKQVERYRALRPEHKNYKIFGGIAGFKVPADVVKRAQERGLFVLQRKGELIDSVTEGMRPFDNV